VSGDYLSPSLPLAVEPLLVSDRLFHVAAALGVACGSGASMISALPVSSVSLAEALMWAVFIACLAALFTYDTISWLIRSLVDFFVKLDQRGGWGGRSDD
jgi:hypothetical protein